MADALASITGGASVLSPCTLLGLGADGDAFPCLSQTIECCPMNEVLARHQAAKLAFLRSGKKYAAWVVCQGESEDRPQACTLVFLDQEPTHAVIQAQTPATVLRFSVARFDCAPECSCHTHGKTPRQEMAGAAVDSAFGVRCASGF